jgi:hypothetical protein
MTSKRSCRLGYTGTDTAAGAMEVITRADLVHFLSSTATTNSPSDGLRINEKIIHVAPERPIALAKRPTAKEQVIQAAIASMAVNSMSQSDRHAIRRATSMATTAISSTWGKALRVSAKWRPRQTGGSRPGLAGALKQIAAEAERTIWQPANKAAMKDRQK